MNLSIYFKSNAVVSLIISTEIEERITKFYKQDITNILDNSSIYEKGIVDDYKDIILKKWIPDLGEVNLKSSKF